MWAQAQYTRDKLEEELSRVCFRMEVEENARAFGQAYQNRSAEQREGRRYAEEELPEVARLSSLSNALLEAYCILRDAPADQIGDGSPRARYGLMGALMAATDAASEAANEAARGVPQPSEATATT
jgi:hypothetical protein